MAASPSIAPPPKGDVAQFARLWRFLAPYRWKIACALAALVVAASCVPSIAARKTEWKAHLRMLDKIDSSYKN